MAFRLRQHESIAHGLRRRAAKQLLVARDELRRKCPPPDEAIHEARKRIKKARAIADLIEADSGRGLNESQKRLRKVSRALSQLRDSDAMLEILAKLRDKNPHLFSEHAFARITRRLTLHKQAAMKAAQEEGRWEKVDRQLRKLRHAVKRWRPAHRHFGALAPGMRATYRRGRKAMARARTHQRAADFHKWRKQIKELWYQLRLVEGSSRAIRKNITVLHRAEAWLGDDHNVVVLCGELSKDASACDLEHLRSAAVRYQAGLRKKAVAATARIYASKPAAYVLRVKQAWNAWQRQHHGDRKRRTRRKAA
jgi:CHAD domain-containing protein